MLLPFEKLPELARFSSSTEVVTAQLFTTKHKIHAPDLLRVNVGEANHPGPGLCKDCREAEKGCQNVYWKHRGWGQHRGGH